MTDTALAADAIAETEARPKVRGTIFVSAAYHAHQIADDCMAGFWLETYDHADVVGYRRDSAEKSLRQLAALFGFGLVAVE